MIKTPIESNIENIIQDLKKNDAIDAAAEIYQQKKLDPVIVLKNVSKLTDPTTIIKIICNMNDTLNNMEDNMKYLFVFKSKDSSNDIVIHVKPVVYSAIKNLDYIFTENGMVK